MSTVPTTGSSSRVAGSPTDAAALSPPDRRGGAEPFRRAGLCGSCLLDRRSAVLVVVIGDPLANSAADTRLIPPVTVLHVPATVMGGHRSHHLTHHRVGPHPASGRALAHG